jgi:ABC-type transporter Mla maintaining outer membrane lipid asymmetry permease subunit MlaE
MVLYCFSFLLALIHVSSPVFFFSVKQYFNFSDVHLSLFKAVCKGQLIVDKGMERKKGMRVVGGENGKWDTLEM